MSPDAIERCASLYYTLRTNNHLLDQLPAELKPQSLADAYAVQDRLFEMLEVEIGGWFLGCTNPDIQRQLGITHPYAARLLRPVLHPSPAVVAVARQLPIVLEVEFAFELGADLPSRPAPYSTEEVAGAVATLHPAIEVVVSHLADWTHQPFFDLVADNGTDGALVCGDGVSAWRDIDLFAVNATLTINDQLVQQGAGANIERGPLAMLTWLANHVSDKGIGLERGQICNTGSCTSIQYVEPGSTAVAVFDDLGSVRVELSG